MSGQGSNEALNFGTIVDRSTSVAIFEDGSGNRWELLLSGNPEIVKELQHNLPFFFAVTPLDSGQDDGIRALISENIERFRTQYSDQPPIDDNQALGQGLRELSEIELTVNLPSVLQPKPYMASFIFDPMLAPTSQTQLEVAANVIIYPSWTLHFGLSGNDTAADISFRANYTVSVSLSGSNNNYASTQGISGNCNAGGGNSWTITVRNSVDSVNNFSVWGDLNVYT